MKIFKGKKSIFENSRFVGSSGLMFRKKPGLNEAVILKGLGNSRLFSMIHMLFVFFPLYIIWLDNQKNVVDIKKAYPFQLFSAPRNPACYVIECIKLPEIRINDRLEF